MQPKLENIAHIHVFVPDRQEALDWYSTILGLEPDASEEDTKRAWRALIIENHPDRAIARGLPQEFIDLATDKLASINDAYDRISRRRGSN